jgi:hypothetical protein
MVEGTAAELFDPSQTVVELNTLDNTKALVQLQQTRWNTYLQSSTKHNLFLKMDRLQIPTFHKALVEMDIPVLSLQPRHSLEDYFLQVTTGNQHVEAFSD